VTTGDGLGTFPIARAALRVDTVPMLYAATDRGPAIEWDGDFFGAAANLAAHVASPAGPGEILSSEAADVHP
jgi:class 3 adenylate cyclase